MSDHTVSAGELGYFLNGLTPRRVQQLAADGVVFKSGRGRYNLSESVRGYCAYMQRLNSAAQGEPDTFYGDAKNQKMRADADKAIMEAAQLAGNLVPAEIVAFQWSHMVGAFRAKLLNLPKRPRRSFSMRQRLENVTPLYPRQYANVWANYHSTKLRTNITATLSNSLLAPPPKSTVSEWAARKRKLSSEASAEPGKWSNTRARYQVGIMDACCDEDTTDVTAMLSSQTGKTEIINNVLGRHIDEDPCPVMVVFPTKEIGQAYSKDRLDPMIRDSGLGDKVAVDGSRKKDNTVLHKSFPGGHVTISGANSPASLSSRPIRVVLCDEVDRFPYSAGEEGDPEALAFKRTQTFYNKKRIDTSTPTVKGLSRIEDRYKAGNMQMYFVP